MEAEKPYEDCLGFLKQFGVFVYRGEALVKLVLSHMYLDDWIVLLIVLY